MSLQAVLAAVYIIFVAFSLSLESSNVIVKPLIVLPLENITTSHGGGKLSNDLVLKSDSDPHWRNNKNLTLAQDGEDVWAYENWFYGVQNGVIIESGALDGKRLSTSYFFEKYADWIPIHIEADPENYNSLVINRPNCKNFNAALCTESKPLHFINQKYINGFESGNVRGIIEFMPKSFLDKFWNDGNRAINFTNLDQFPLVSCTSMQQIAKGLNLKVVDLWVLDVEGAELSVLNGTDFQSVQFRTIIMECDKRKDDDGQSIDNLKIDILHNQGFNCCQLGNNCMCKHHLYTPSQAANAQHAISTCKPHRRRGRGRGNKGSEETRLGGTREKGAGKGKGQGRVGKGQGKELER